LAGNYGLEDQILALKWIHTNAETMSLDAHAITVGGESAGAACASLLAVSPVAKGV
jgi:carboxylesterase type B